MPDRFALKVNDLSKPLFLTVHSAGDQYVSKAIRETGQWEIYETELILSCIKKGQTFVDVGANIGYFSVIAGDRVGAEGNVFCFEPEARNFSVLQKNIHDANLPQVKLEQAALSDHEGRGEIYLSDDNYGDHQVYRNHEELTDRPQQAIRFVQGDNYLAHLPSVDFIKIDTQGAEFHVISGLQKTIERSLPHLNMLIEFWPHGLSRSGGDAHQLLDRLLAFHLPMAIIDHINHCLIPCKESDLRPWIDEVNNDPNNEGFMNLFFGEI